MNYFEQLGTAESEKMLFPREEPPTGSPILGGYLWGHTIYTVQVISMYLGENMIKTTSKKKGHESEKEQGARYMTEGRRNDIIIILKSRKKVYVF